MAFFCSEILFRDINFYWISGKFLIGDQERDESKDYIQYFFVDQRCAETKLIIGTMKIIRSLPKPAASQMNNMGPGNFTS